MLMLMLLLMILTVWNDHGGWWWWWWWWWSNVMLLLLLLWWWWWCCGCCGYGNMIAVVAENGFHWSRGTLLLLLGLFLCVNDEKWWKKVCLFFGGVSCCCCFSFIKVNVKTKWMWKWCNFVVFYLCHLQGQSNWVGSEDLSTIYCRWWWWWWPKCFLFLVKIFCAAFCLFVPVCSFVVCLLACFDRSREGWLQSKGSPTKRQCSQMLFWLLGVLWFDWFCVVVCVLSFPKSKSKLFLSCFFFYWAKAILLLSVFRSLVAWEKRQIESDDFRQRLRCISDGSIKVKCGECSSL